MQRISGAVFRRASIGYYMVLMPISIAAWSDPYLWFPVALALVGLIVVTLAAKRAVTGIADTSN